MLKWNNFKDEFYWIDTFNWNIQYLCIHQSMNNHCILRFFWFIFEINWKIISKWTQFLVDWFTIYKQSAKCNTDKLKWRKEKQIQWKQNQKRGRKKKWNSSQQEKIDNTENNTTNSWRNEGKRSIFYKRFKISMKTWMIWMKDNTNYLNKFLLIYLSVIT